VLTFSGVTGLHIEQSLSYLEVAPLVFEDMKERGWDSPRWRVHDSESESLEFGCDEFSWRVGTAHDDLPVP
jgi:hypothetical protein